MHATYAQATIALCRHEQGVDDFQANQAGAQAETLQ